MSVCIAVILIFFFFFLHITLIIIWGLNVIHYQQNNVTMQKKKMYFLYCYFGVKCTPDMFECDVKPRVICSDRDGSHSGDTAVFLRCYSEGAGLLIRLSLRLHLLLDLLQHLMHPPQLQQEHNHSQT